MVELENPFAYLPIVGSKKASIDFRDPTVLSLLFSNLATIAMAIAFDWSALAIMWVYWAQSVIIGFFQFFKILALQNFSVEGFKINGRQVQATKTQIKVFTALFFAFHYGFFHFGYAGFLFGFSSAFFSANVAFAQEIQFVLAGIAIFFANHLFSFVYYLKKPKPVQNIVRVMFEPYVRIIPMHLTIIFGGIFLSIGAFQGAVTALFLLLKTCADIAMHAAEHSAQQGNKN